MKVIRCKFCGNTTINRYSGYCQNCYHYFVYNKYTTFDDVEFGKLSYVLDINSQQYGMPICHICHKAYTKLQQHIYYKHHITKSEYCLQFGLDKNVRMTTNEYNQKMRDYAFKYNMDEQVKRVGEATRFTKGYKADYIRSPMTKKRLSEWGHRTGPINGKKHLKKVGS